ncbi:MAG: DAK2 domain-containing protein [Defluviitaleaceae bacterium]|nr:DAK2 domain-containing protein [Defluviitaleaceae bacterium]
MSDVQRITKLDGKMLRNMIIEGSNRLTANKARIDALNVFPVPDGDTGTNMSLTALAAAKEVEKLDTDDIFAVSKAAASGALRGGRGNSGVIFSQLFRGFSKALDGKTTANTAEIAMALAGASKTAYKAVMRPQEGTMLTVARHMAEGAEKAVRNTKDMGSFLQRVLDEGSIALRKTPEMLPVLKQAGVVDSGGEGIVVFFKGMLKGMTAENVKLDGQPIQEPTEEVNFSALANFSTEEITFGYCTEFFINVQNFSEDDEDSFKAYLETMGDSIALVADDEIVKIHVHTDHPGAVMEKAMEIGPLSSLKIENMRFQHHEAVTFLDGMENQALFTAPVKTEAKDLGIVAISSGAGFRQIFEELGVDYIVEGGQTMNPSAEDIASAISKINAPNIIVLPNNKNIILAAKQTEHLCEDKNIFVVESKNLPQGIAAMINHMPDNTVEENVEAMTETLSEVTVGQITYAVRDTEMDGQKVNEGDYIGILGGKIACSHQDIDISVKELINAIMADEPDVLTVYLGADVKEDAETTANIESYIAENYESCELEIVSGGQPVYHYIFSAE